MLQITITEDATEWTGDNLLVLELKEGKYALFDGAHRVCAFYLAAGMAATTLEKWSWTDPKESDIKFMAKIMKPQLTVRQMADAAGFRNIKASVAARLTFRAAVSIFCCKQSHCYPLDFQNAKKLRILADNKTPPALVANKCFNYPL